MPSCLGLIHQLTGRLALNAAGYIALVVKDATQDLDLFYPYSGDVTNSANESFCVQIRSRDGQVAEVPSIILVIPPPDTRCFEKAQR